MPAIAGVYSAFVALLRVLLPVADPAGFGREAADVGGPAAVEGALGVLTAALHVHMVVLRTGSDLLGHVWWQTNRWRMDTGEQEVRRVGGAGGQSG